MKKANIFSSNLFVFWLKNLIPGFVWIRWFAPILWLVLLCGLVTVSLW